MRQARMIMIVVAMIMTGLAVGSQSPALAWGNESGCAGHTRFNHTNYWDKPFVGHRIAVVFRGCMTVGSKTRGPHLIWTARPKVTLPSKPMGGIVESADVSTAPFYVSSKVEPGSGTVVVRYKWVVKLCTTITAKKFCEHYEFGGSYSLYGSKICFWGGSCDAVKKW